MIQSLIRPLSQPVWQEVTGNALHATGAAGGSDPTGLVDEANLMHRFTAEGLSLGLLENWDGLNGAIATPFDAERTPTVKDLNGVRVVHFESDLMRTTDIAPPPKVSVYVTYRPGVVDPWPRPVVAQDNSGSQRSWRLDVNYGVATFIHFTGSSGNGAPPLGPVSAGVWYTQSGRRSETEFQGQLNGTPGALTQHGGTNGADLPISIGGMQNNSNRWASIYIREIRMYEGYHDDITRAAVEAEMHIF